MAVTFPNIILAGIICSGKSSVGRALAEITGYHYLDTDELMVQSLRLPPQQITTELSRLEFQQAENRVIHQIVYQQGLIVALGGGTISHENEALRLDNIAHLKKLGTLIHLDASVETLFRRYQKDLPQENLLRRKEPDIFQSLKTRREGRLSFHRTVCDFSIDTSDLTVQQVAQAVLNLFSKEELAKEDT